MKIQCDVCEKEEASIFCSADEAALCEACDIRVHHANKLATKHIRFSLQSPSLKDSPRCDICQDKRALLFCKEDRAILCKECDISIHKANEHTKKHNRFLLTGAKLSSTISSTNQAKASSSSSVSNAYPTTKTNVINSGICSPNSSAKTLESTSNISEANSHSINQTAPDSITTSMSDYLMETLPGWHVEDLLDPYCSPDGTYF